jgi:cytosine deaminase
MNKFCITNVRLGTKATEPLRTIVVESGVIVDVKSAGALPESPTMQSLDAKGRFANSGFVESHLHLEKAFLLDQLTHEAETLDDAIAITGELKKCFTKEDIAERARRVLEHEIHYGTTAVRAHVEVDDVLQLKAIETILQLKQEFSDRLRMQIVVFPQEGIFKQRDVKDLMHAALDMGADVVGGIPYNDPDPEEHLDFVFDLAQHYGKPVDVHIDLSDNPEQLDIVSLAHHTIRYGMQGSVTAGHLTSLGSVPADKAARIADLIAEAGITVASLPLTDVYLNGRDDAQAPRRGVTPVGLLMKHGANVVISTNNIQNAFTPFGNGDPLNPANMTAELEHMGSAVQQHAIMNAITVNAEEANHFAGRECKGIAQGAPANIVLFNAHSEREVFLEHPPIWASFVNGLPVVKPDQSVEGATV